MHHPDGLCRQPCHIEIYVRFMRSTEVVNFDIMVLRDRFGTTDLGSFM